MPRSTRSEAEVERALEAYREERRQRERMKKILGNKVNNMVRYMELQEVDGAECSVEELTAMQRQVLEKVQKNGTVMTRNLCDSPRFPIDGTRKTLQELVVKGFVVRTELPMQKNHHVYADSRLEL